MEIPIHYQQKPNNRAMSNGCDGSSFVSESDFFGALPAGTSARGGGGEGGEASIGCFPGQMA